MHPRGNPHTLAQARRRASIDKRQRALTALAALERQGKKITPHGPAVQQVRWQDRPALQIFRRSNRRDAAVDNAALKAERIRRWLADQ
jgi:hypothetical protein